MTEGKYARILAKIQVSAILQMQDIWEMIYPKTLFA